MTIEKYPIAQIGVSEYNPRVALERQSREYQAIKKSIEDYGLVEPVVVNDVTMSCIGGHQRLAVLRDMGETEVDCAMVHITDPEREKALCVALNKIKGEWDEEKLNELLADPEIQEFELGFENIEVSLDDTLDGNDDIGEDDDSEEAMESEEDYTPSYNDEIADAGMVIKIGVYKFNTTVSEYEQLMASIRDKGIFGKQETIEEFMRRLCND